jgi:DNA-binding transcriptional regulator YiaG
VGKSKNLFAHPTATLRRISTATRTGARKRIHSSSTRTHPIEIKFRGNMPRRVIEDLRRRYADWILAISGDYERVDLSKTAEWREFKKRQSPGVWIAGLRKKQGWTQKELGSRLGGVSATSISDWEHDRKAVSKARAKMLAYLFRISAEWFI